MNTWQIICTITLDTGELKQVDICLSCEVPVDHGNVRGILWALYPNCTRIEGTGIEKIL